MVSAVGETKRRLGALGKRFHIVAVSVDPLGDTPQAVKTFLTERGLYEQADYLNGTPSELRPIWKRWGVGAEINAKTKAALGHLNLILLIDPNGMLTAGYPSAPTAPSPTLLAKAVRTLLKA